MTVFGKYADFYDALYQDKNYKEECNKIHKIFSTSKRKIRTVLDLGCGTGNHSHILNRMGYNVVGVDISRSMINHARKKISEVNNKMTLRFEVGNLKSWSGNQAFDAVLMMFAVLGYQIKNEDIMKAFANVRRHLRKNGLFIFDAWYGPGVLSQKPSVKIKTVQTSEGIIKRTATSDLYDIQNIVSVHYTAELSNRNSIVSRTKETHTMRYFFIPELEYFLSQNKLQMTKVTSFDDWKSTPSTDSWNIVITARAVE